MRDRSSVVIIENKKVVLIQRIRENSVYYVFPGGGIEHSESPKVAAKREALEELGVEVNVNECLLEVTFNGTQYFFLSDIVNGTIGTGHGDEYTDQNRDRGTYTPLWIAIDCLASIDVRPKEVALKLKSII